MKLHAKYGVVVRVHPDELSFIGSSAWQDIYTARPQLPKPTFGVIETPSGVPSMGTIPDAETHGRQRKIISHAFSDRALLSQEYILQKYTDLLIDRLRAQPNLHDGTLDICSWYNFTTFDVLGDLCFAESFHCLETAENHPWVAAVFVGVKVGQLLTLFHHFPPLDTIVKWCIPSFVIEEAQKSFTFTRERVDKRIASKSERPDFMQYILQNNYPGGLSREEVNSTTTLLVLAGSETSALTLTSATYFSLKNPPVMERLVQEIRQAFKSQEEITIAAVSNLPYMHAVIQEALRVHPTGPISVPRQVDRPDVQVCGMHVPQGVCSCLLEPLVEVADRESRYELESHKRQPSDLHRISSTQTHIFQSDGSMMQILDLLKTTRLCLSLSWLGHETASGRRELLSPLEHHSHG